MVPAPRGVFWETRSSDCQAHEPLGPEMTQHHFCLVLGVRAASEPAQIQGQVGEDQGFCAVSSPPWGGHLTFFLPIVSGNAQASTPRDSDFTGPGCGLGMCMKCPQVVLK